MDIKKLLEKYKIVPDPIKDQFFLWDEKVINRIVELSDLSKKDTVLEIGAGLGNLTGQIAQKAGHVIAFEIDPKFRPFLMKLPKNVEVHYENAWEYIQLHGKFRKKKEYNKVVSNLPYSFAEQFLHNLTFLNYEKVILVVPLKFVNKIETNGIFASFFRADVKILVDKESFYPKPRINSAVIDLVKLPDPVKTQDLELFLRQYIYQHEGQLVKNSLMEGLIKFRQLVYGKDLTKNEARKIVAESGIDKDLLETAPNNAKIYQEINDYFHSSGVFSG